MAALTITGYTRNKYSTRDRLLHLFIYLFFPWNQNIWTRCDLTQQKRVQGWEACRMQPSMKRCPHTSVWNASLLRPTAIKGTSRHWFLMQKEDFWWSKASGKSTCEAECMKMDFSHQESCTLKKKLWKGIPKSEDLCSRTHEGVWECRAPDCRLGVKYLWFTPQMFIMRLRCAWCFPNHCEFRYSKISCQLIHLGLSL